MCGVLLLVQVQSGLCDIHILTNIHLFVHRFTILMIWWAIWFCILFLRREIIFKYNMNQWGVLFYVYNTSHCLCSMGPFCSVQDPAGMCSQNWMSGWNKHKEIRREFVQPVTCTQGGAPNCRVNMSPVIHPSYITQQQLPQWHILNPTSSVTVNSQVLYVDLFCFRQHDSDTELTCLESWGVRLDNVIANVKFL